MKGVVRMHSRALMALLYLTELREIRVGKCSIVSGNLELVVGKMGFDYPTIASRDIEVQ